MTAIVAPPERSGVRRRLYTLLFGRDTTDRAGRWFELAMLALIGVNLLAAILETEPALGARYASAFSVLEIASVAIFTVEYVLRLWACTGGSEYGSPVSGRLRYAVTPLAICDLAAIVPFYLTLGTVDLRFTRAVRLLRLVRLAKVGRYSESIQTLANVVRAKRAELTVTLFSGAILLTVAGSIMYWLEREAQPEVFSSIPAAMWWGVATLTTVGYGDIYPVTVLGKVVGSFIAVLGVGMFALPAGIIASGFAAELQAQRPRRQCPHCGKDIDAAPDEGGGTE